MSQPPAVSPVATAPPAPRSSGERGGLARALLAYVVGVTLVITLTPFEFAVPPGWQVTVSDWTVLDLIANVLLFVPIGFLSALGWPAAARHVALCRALGMGTALSLMIESAQLFEVARYSSPWDVLTNAAGALSGAALTLWLRRRLDPSRLVGRLALELPLVGVVYLLVPLGWLQVLAASGGTTRAWPLLALGLFGGSLLGAVQRRYLGPAGLAGPRAMAAAAGGWFVLATVPAVTYAPQVVVAGALLVTLFTWHRSAAQTPDGGDRRFERAALLRAAPFFVAYLLLLALTAAGAGERLEREYVVGLVEGVAAFTVLGYVVAEAMGRREQAYRDSWLAVAALAAAAAVADVVLRQGGAAHGDARTVGTLGASVVAAVYGGWLYHVQRDQVRRLVQHAHSPTGVQLPARHAARRPDGPDLARQHGCRGGRPREVGAGYAGHRPPVA